MLVSWGDLIRARFKTDNLPITSRLQHYPDMKPLVDVLSDLSSKYVAQQQIMLANNLRQLARDNLETARHNLIVQKLGIIEDHYKRILELQGDPAPVRPDNGKSSADTEIKNSGNRDLPPLSPTGAGKRQQGNVPHEAGSSSTQSLSMPPVRSECPVFVSPHDIVYMFTCRG